MSPDEYFRAIMKFSFSNSETKYLQKDYQKNISVNDLFKSIIGTLKSTAIDITLIEMIVIPNDASMYDIINKVYSIDPVIYKPQFIQKDNIIFDIKNNNDNARLWKNLLKENSHLSKL